MASSGSGSPPSRWVTGGVVSIVVATFFSDVGHEMVTAVLPMYLASVGLGAAALGVLEGVADLAFSLSKLGGGLAGHHAPRHKRALATTGYTLTAVGTAAIALTASAFGVAVLRGLAWLGRGFRSPLRDALLAEEVPPTHFGRAYGIERSADMLGAVAGPLLALALRAAGASLPTIILVSFGPSLVAVVAMATLRAREAAAARPTAQAASRRLPPTFWAFVGAVLLFGLGDFSRTFLVVLAARAFGGSTVGGLEAGILAYALHNVVSGLAAAPAGRLADHRPKTKVLAAGYLLGVVTQLLLLYTIESKLVIAAVVVLSGTYIAIEETVEKATAAELLPASHRSLGFGVLAWANAVGDLVSSLYVGFLLDTRPRLAFGLAAAASTAGATALLLVARRAAGASNARPAP